MGQFDSHSGKGFISIADGERIPVDYTIRWTNSRGIIRGSGNLAVHEAPGKFISLMVGAARAVLHMKNRTKVNVVLTEATLSGNPTTGAFATSGAPEDDT